MQTLKSYYPCDLARGGARQRATCRARNLSGKALGLALALALSPAVGATVPEHAHHDGASAATGGHDPHAHHRAMLSKPPQAGATTDVKLLDRELLDQEGRHVRFASEAIGDRIVAVDFVYTTCTTVCPVLSAVFAQVQDRLGDRLGRDVALVSVTVDPVRDNPQRLRAYAAKHGARDGWTWLTGSKRAVDEVLTGMGAYTSNFEDHPAMVLVGDGRTGEWTRFFGFPGTDQIMGKIDELTAARQSVAATE